MVASEGGLFRRLKPLVLRNRTLFLPLIALAKFLRNKRVERRLKASYPNVEIITYDRNEVLKSGGVSELGQDIYVLERLAPEGFKGVFLDIGCNHATLGNNSFALEKAGWSGFAFEPQSRFFESWVSERKTPIIQAAISNQVAEVDFVEFEIVHGWEHLLSGFLDHADPAQLSARPHKVIKVQTGPVAHFIEDTAQVDLALIDVEGAEMQVLDGMGDVQPKWIIIENNREPVGNEALRQRLITQGYSFVARIGHTDDVFVRA